MKNTKAKEETETTRPRRKSSRTNSTVNDSIETLAIKVGKVDELKLISDDIKSGLHQNDTQTITTKSQVKKEAINDEKKPAVENNDIDHKPIENVDRRVISLEEEDAETRDSANDLVEFQKTCSNIEAKLSKINALKKGPSSSQNLELITDYRVDATLLTTNLKTLNRLTQIRGKLAREKTQEVKKKVDGLHLDLQNLLYELMHVKREIQKCMNFSSKDEEIDLVDIDKFYEEAPEAISQPDLTKDNKHQQMLARLDWELNKRKELSTAKDALVTDKKKTESEINQKADYLCNLKPRLEQIVKASRPVQEYMNIPLEAEALLQEKALFLSRPLYVLYIQAKAYKDVCDKNINVDIQGDLLEAKNLFYADDVDDLDVSDASETETEAEIEEQNSSRKHKRDKERLNEQRTQLLRRHPLTVVLDVSEKGVFKIQLTFCHYPSLKINTVKVEVELDKDFESYAKSPLLSSTNIFQDLLTADTGKISPNSANTYQLERLKMDSFQTHIGEIGLPYFWVQWICGLNYLPNEDMPSSVPDASFSVKHFQTVVRKIKSRLRSRLCLQKQVQSLEQLIIPDPKRESMKESIPKNIVSMLTSWVESSFDDFQTFGFPQELEDLGVVTEDCTFHKATFTKDESLIVMVVLHTDYPKQPPLLLLSLKNGNRPVNADADLKVLESEVNSHVEELMEKGQPNLLLSNMLRRLQFCFDIYCETGPKSDAKERLYARKIRGRDRRRPYRFHDDGYFVQR